MSEHNSWICLRLHVCADVPVSRLKGFARVLTANWFYVDYVLKAVTFLCLKCVFSCAVLGFPELFEELSTVKLHPGGLASQLAKKCMAHTRANRS